MALRRAFRVVLLSVVLLCAATIAPEPSVSVTLGDGSDAKLQLGWFPTDRATTDAFCDAYGVSDAADRARLHEHVQDRLRPARFFTAFTEEAADHPSAARRFAFLDGELMFQSTGTSNPGRNYPDFWLPTAGVCPFWFQQGNPTSFADPYFAPGNDRERMRRTVAASAVPHVFDKRYDANYAAIPSPNTPSFDASTFARLTASVRAEEALNGTAPVDARAGHFVFYRFSSLRQVITSVRLGRNAWEQAGYDTAAILDLGAAAGFDIREVADDRGALVVKGACAVNDLIVDVLGFEIFGWRQARKVACGDEVAFLVDEAERLMADARLAANVALGENAIPRGPEDFVSQPFDVCTSVRIEACVDRCCVPSLLETAYWPRIARLSRRNPKAKRGLLAAAEFLEVLLPQIEEDVAAVDMLLM